MLRCVQGLIDNCGAGSHHSELLSQIFKLVRILAAQHITTGHLRHMLELCQGPAAPLVSELG